MKRKHNDAEFAHPDELIVLSIDLPPLPSSIRYWDDFADLWKTIPDPASDDWPFHSDGESRFLHFQFFPKELRTLIKHWAVYVIGKNACATVSMYFTVMTADRGELFNKVLRLTTCDQLSIRKEWMKHFFTLNQSIHYLMAIKSLLKYLCHISYESLTPECSDVIAGLPLPKVDKYASVREGGVFLSLREDKLIIDHLDSMSSRVIDNSINVSTRDLRATCILCISYQYAMRPIQIARVSLEDVTTYVLQDSVAIHVRFLRAKQRKGTPRYAMVRKVKREWSCVFKEFIARRDKEIGSIKQINSRSDSLFGLTPAGVSQLLIKTLADLGIEHHNATDLRHSAAQRMVDAGASHVELAEYMGHAWADTSLVYYDVSATQAERINQALALSPIYSVLTEVATKKTIELGSLSAWPPEKQIAAVPHGIPIYGIGACELGQHLCTKNPVTSCYGCDNFLPVSDRAIHKGVLESLRPVVIDFYESSRGEGYSPAYMQLRSTLESVANIIDQLEGDEDEQG
ncbi:tyrosine-type recombinase/integrase [Pseudomonas aeruginosa]|nr:site-specific integrase [Pseudomonas aeruginosa]